MNQIRQGLPAEAVRWVDDALASRLFSDAEGTDRQRLNLNFHRTLDENPHRFLNAMIRGTYVRPHRHLFPPKAETFLVLEGALLFLIFDEQGMILSGRVMAAPGHVFEEEDHREQVRRELRSAGETWGVDIDPGLWHTLLPLTERVLIFEVKPGPYRKTDDKEFAPWSPPEGDQGCQAFLESLYARCLLPDENSQTRMGEGDRSE